MVQLPIQNNVHHGGSKTNHFVMEATGTFNKPLDRQVDESIRLKFLIDLASFLIQGLNGGATPYLELHSMLQDLRGEKGMFEFKKSMVQEESLD